jgi:putative FmdB family regulatory protein
VPIYEFICYDCDTEFEKLLSFSSSIVAECPSCQGINVKRQMGLPAVHFKGSGWYITDSKKSVDSKKSASDAPSASSDAPEKSDSIKDSSTTPESTNNSKKSETESPSAVKAAVSE